MPVDDATRSGGRLERILALRSFPGLAGVDPSHLALMADVLEERTFSRGETLIPPGQPTRFMYLIRRGEVAVMRDGIPVRQFRSGSIIGTVGALTGDPSGPHFVAREHVRAFSVARDDLHDVLEESFELLLSALRGLLRTVIDTRLRLPSDAGFSAEVAEGEGAPAELGLVERVLFLRRLLTYGQSSVEALTELAREMTLEHVPRGTELWRVGDRAPHSLLVWSGVVEARTANGQRFQLGPDSVVGGMDSIAAVPRWYGAVARTDVVALRGDAEHLVDVIEEHPDMGLDMLRAAARIVADLTDRLDRLSAGG